MKQIKKTLKTTREIVKYTLSLLPITITLGFPSRTDPASPSNQSYVYVEPERSLTTYTSIPKLEDIIQPTLSRPATYPSVQDSTYYKRLASKIAREEGLDPALVQAVINAESSWNPNAVSPKGAKGLMQLKSIAVKEVGMTEEETRYPEGNIRAGTRYLKVLLTKYHGDVRKALAAYNAGPTAVQRSNNIPTYTKKYVDRVVGYMSKQGPKG